MFLYAKLYLAHMLGDFVFQFEELYTLKTKSILGHFSHIIIHIGFMALLAWPYLGNPLVWFSITAIALIHFSQDFIKYSLTSKKPGWRFMLFAVDQIFHVIVIFMIFFFPFSSQVLSFEGPAWLRAFYLDTESTWILILFFWATFGMGYTLHSFRLNYIKDTRPKHFITSPEMTHGLIERTLLTFILAFGGRPEVLFLAPFVLLLRVPFKILHSKMDIFLNVAACLLLAVCWRVFT